MFRSLTFLAALSVASFVAAPLAHATNPLTPKEAKVCPSLRGCLSILSRHDASEFDYAVLEAEFRRYGPRGRKALFDLLESKAGNPDMARMILALGPLTTTERRQVQAMWGGPKTLRILPFADESWEWEKLLDHEDRYIREIARRQMFAMDKEARSVLQNRITDYGPILRDLTRHPSAFMARYLEGIPAQNYQDELRSLLLSGQAKTVGQAYAALYRADEKAAFESLLAALRKADELDQATAMGSMLAARHATREDGFYARFATQLSADTSFPVGARAAALDALLKIEGETTPLKLTPPRDAAFGFLLAAPNPYAVQYAKPLKARARQALPALFKHMIANVTPNAHLAVPQLEGHPQEEAILRAALGSADRDLISAAATRLKAMGQNTPAPTWPVCQFEPFDIENLRVQMPFFDEGYIPGSWPDIRVPASRGMLSAAHPTENGWLGGYDFGEFGGGIVYYDNRTGENRNVAMSMPYLEGEIDSYDPENVIAILPDRPLKLGQSTSTFWVVTGLNHFGVELAVRRVSLTPNGITTRTIARNLGGSERIGLNASGDLLLADSEGRTVRLTPKGEVRYSCADGVN